MRRRNKTGGKVVKERRNAPKTARHRSSAAPAKEVNVERIARERDEALERETATADILNIISNSPTDTQPVFDAIVQSGLKLFPDALISLALRYGDMINAAAIAERDPERAEAWRRTISRTPFTREYMHGAAMLDCRIVDIPDVRSAPAELSAGARNFLTSGYRAITITPMMRRNEAIGLLSVVRRTPGPLSDKQLAVLRTFAAQAVIAIENARLLDDLNKLNQQLEQRVTDQVSEIERIGRLRRFLPPQVADLIVASGTEKQLESHRREITALFCDLRGFTGFSESSDPEDVMALLREYHVAIGQIINKYGGTLERYAGDGVMVVFNDPIPVDNPALQAVLMAIDMRAAIGELIEKWRKLGHDIALALHTVLPRLALSALRGALIMPPSGRYPTWHRGFATRRSRAKY
jgi:class 3 adenylate cyclase